jgi:hypothetical protein
MFLGLVYSIMIVTSILGFIESVRNPDHTGENRCLPCTFLNAVLVLAAGAVAAIAWMPVGILVVASGFLLLSLRGYVVPKTPQLTEKYLPPQVLIYFGKKSYQPIKADGGSRISDSGKTEDIEGSESETRERTPDQVLLDSSVLHEDGQDPSLDPEFETTWRKEITDIRERAGDANVLTELSSLLGVRAQQLSFERFNEESHVIVRNDGQAVGQWVSDAALVADATAAGLLETWVKNWSQLDTAFRGTVLTNLRLFVPECPACGGGTKFTEEDKGCCGVGSAYTLRCTEADCEAVIYRVDKDAVDTAQQ